MGCEFEGRSQAEVNILHNREEIYLKWVKKINPKWIKNLNVNLQLWNYHRKTLEVTGVRNDFLNGL
jgi:hypothetical protein